MIKNNHGILYETKEEDLKLIRYLVKEFTYKDYGSKDNELYTEKILNHIKTKEWKETYKSKQFIFIFDSYARRKYVNVKFMLMCQVLEIMYFYNCYNKDPEKLRHIKFKNKIKEVFNYFFPKEMKDKNANILRILRNCVAHTGAITYEDIHKKALTKNERSLIEDFMENKDMLEIAINFNLLMEEIFMMSLGLSRKEARKVPPAWKRFLK